MKKTIYIIMITLLLAGCGKKDASNLKAENIEIEIEESEIYDNVDIKLDKFYYQDEYTTVNLIITNNNDYTVNIGSYKVYAYDKNNNLIGEFSPKLDENINPNSSTNQMFSINDDLRKTEKIDYEFNNIQKID